MNQEEITAYLAASHIAVVATMNRHGHPLNLQRDNHLSVCMYDPPVASNYVVIAGTATCNDPDIWDEARRILERYRAPDEVDIYVARWKTEPRVLLTVPPEHIATRAPR